MKMKAIHRVLAIVSLLILVVFFGSCKKKGCTNPYARNYNPEATKDDNCSCQMYVDNMLGIYRVTVTSYPLQPIQEGDQFYVHINNDYGVCPVDDSRFESVLKVRMYNFSYNFDCQIFNIDKNQFTVDSTSWAGGKMWGTGTINNGILHFEGTVANGNNLIVLDGERIDNVPTTTCN